MIKPPDKVLRYFVEIEISTGRIIRAAAEHKNKLDKGRQNDASIHRLFLTKGQYNKLQERCAFPA